MDKVLDPEFLVDLPDWPLDELRRRQDERLEIETAVSYVRRITQARIDILEAEIDRRASGGSIGDLIAALPEILDDDELQSTLRELGQLEQQVSQQRRQLHQVIDRMEADLAARHQGGPSVISARE
jgi:hypothetical protein